MNVRRNSLGFYPLMGIVLPTLIELLARISLFLLYFLLFFSFLFLCCLIWGVFYSFLWAFFSRFFFFVRAGSSGFYPALNNPSQNSGRIGPILLLLSQTKNSKPS